MFAHIQGRVCRTQQLGELRPGLLHHTAEAAAADDEESYYIHRSSIAPETTALLKPAVEVGASAVSAPHLANIAFHKNRRMYLSADAAKAGEQPEG